MLLSTLATGSVSGCDEDAKTPVCLDGVVDRGEACDDGDMVDENGCTNRCTLPVCGDGVAQGETGEQCDDGNVYDDDACTVRCRTASCGDGVVQPVAGEACDDTNGDQHDACVKCKVAACGDGALRLGVESCDDGNQIDDDACSNRCASPSCGDGIVQAPGEECDDANRSNLDGCLGSCLLARCGDGFVEKGKEECDDGNADPGDGCLPGTCKAARCGDGVVRRSVEACDDQNVVNDDDCTNGCALPTCGDALVQPGEGCDDGNLSNQDACLSTCLPAICGDGAVKAGVEACDDGNKDPSDACLNTCVGARCGDGVVWVGVEGCDDQNAENGDGCTNACTRSRCGDGIVETGEECDDGNASNADACLTSCLAALCGDGFVLLGKEACDDANANDHDACLSCVAARCGDGKVRARVEACDDGNLVNSDSCTNTCAPPTCGDGAVQSGEECDDANLSETDACLSSCLLATCGDGTIRVGVEECDDENRIDTDACTNACLLSRCGDGFVQAGEECDDGNGNASDACTNLCKHARCGDAFVFTGREECDDGNTNGQDDCTSVCRVATCGDGFLHQGVEACDDGNASQADACLISCENARCGDGFVFVGKEQCDDKNLDNTDTCLVTCESFDWCTSFKVREVLPQVACLAGTPTFLTLRSSGLGFLTVNGAGPSVTFDGAATTIRSQSVCSTIAGVFESVSGCTTMEIDIPKVLGLGDHPIVVKNPLTAGCTADAVFSVGPPPTIDTVTPATVCLGPATLTFEVTGTGFVSASQVTLGGVAATAMVLFSSTHMQVTFPAQLPGSYDLTVTNGAGCSATKSKSVLVLEPATIFFVDPPVLYNGISTQFTAYLSGINGGSVNKVSIRPTGSGAAPTSLTFQYDPVRPNQVQAVLPIGTAARFYDLIVVDAATGGSGCTAVLESAFQVTGTLGLSLKSIDPPFGFTGDKTPVDLLADNPPPAGKTAFQALPRAYLNPTSGGVASGVTALAFVDAGRLTAQVPPGLTVGTYDVLVVNPDATVGLLPAAFKVTAAAPPVIDTIAPGSVPTGSARTVVISGSGFSSPTVSLDCKDPTTGIVTTSAATVSASSSTSITTSVPADKIAQGSLCVVKVTSADASFGEFAALGVTNPAENLTQMTTSASTMKVARRAPAAVSARVTSRSRFLYAIGGDTGTVGGAMSSVEAVAVDRFGVLAGWRLLPLGLPSPRTLAAAQVLGRFIYLVGGNDGTGAVTSTLRAQILDPDDAPRISEVLLELQTVGLTTGVWYYRVAAVFPSADSVNPGGEGLASDPQPVQIPGGLPKQVRATLSWTAVSGALKYRIYRSPTPQATSGTEELLGTVDAPTLSFTDGGTATSAGAPRQAGDLGAWAQVATLANAREGLGLGLAKDPKLALTYYLYVAGGRSSSSVLPTTYERLPLVVGPDGSQTTTGWVEDLVKTLPIGRWQGAVFTVNDSVTTRSTRGDTWIYVGGGWDAAAGTITDKVHAARVTTGGVLDDGTGKGWLEVPGHDLRAGYGFAAAANQLFVFGGSAGAASTDARSGQICGTGFTCNGGPPDPPDLNNWNATKGLAIARVLMGSVIESGRIFMIGGQGSTGPLDSVDSTVW
jgi:cysteine-rich repeat protein